MANAESTESAGEEDHHRSRMIVACLALVVLMPVATATELGVNYYHESLWTPEWQQPHIPVSEAQARADFKEIKRISNDVKFYLTPFAEGNLGWVDTLTRIAREEGLSVAINIMVDDRRLGDHNWDTYRNGVLRACEQLDGKADVMLVGNEITLHSSWNAWDVRHRIEPLIDECESRFSGETSYEAFWYEKEAFKSYDGPIYFMHYESLGNFETNVQEMDALFGSDAYVGEFGEDLFDEGVKKDDWWQKEQIEKRWDIVERTNAPVAYLFAYREPSWDGFGIVRPDGVKRPLWLVFGLTQDELDRNADPVSEPEDTSEPTDTTTEPASGSELAQLFVESRPGGSLVKDSVSGACRTVAFDTSNGYGEVLICDKGSSYEAYWRSGSSDVSICVEGSCVKQTAGFARISDADVAADPDTTGSDGSGSSDLAGLSVSSSPSGSKSSDVVSGTCRTVSFDTSSGYGEVLICDKGSSYEAYWRSGSSDVSVCVAGSCVRESAGFARIEKTGTSGTVQGSSETDTLTLSSLSASSSPGGTKVKDATSGTCRIAAFDTSAGYAEAQVCDKGSSFEVYWKGGSNQANVCFEDACVRESAGFARIEK